MYYNLTDPDDVLKREKEIVTRYFCLRQLGSLLTLLPTGNVLREEGHLYAMILMAIMALIWPAAALLTALSSPGPLRTESRNLIVDTLMTGFWVGMTGLTPVPSIIIIGITVADRFAIGGRLLVRQSMLAFIASAMAGWLTDGHSLITGFSNLTVWLTLPLASVYIIAMSWTSRRLTTESFQRCLELEKLSFSDPSLGLPNRRAFDVQLHTAFSKTQAGEARAYLMLIDIDYFKRMNDTFGHQAGDLLLTAVSYLLKNNLQPGEIPARLGGDELAIIISDGDEERVTFMASSIVEGARSLSVGEAFHHANSVSIGIACAQGTDSVAEWFAKADTALYRVKNRGKDGFLLAPMAESGEP